jgi:hypothetical protein
VITKHENIYHQNPLSTASKQAFYILSDRISQFEFTNDLDLSGKFEDYCVCRRICIQA